MATAVSDVIGEAARLMLEHGGELAAATDLPAELRPKNLPQAYGIQQAVSRERGAIGGWQICAAGPDVGLACAPLPLATVRPEPARLPIAKDRRFRLRFALGFRIGRSLPEYDAPFEQSEVVAAIESTHPAVLVSDSSLGANGGIDPLTAIAESCATAGLVYGQARPGLPQTEMVELHLVHWFGAKHRRVLGTVPVGNFLAPLTWLANFGAAWGGGLTVGQMAVLALPGEAIPLEPGAWIKCVIGDFGKVTLRAESALS